MQLFYSQHIGDNEISLTDQEAIHCSKVLRRKIGDRLNVLDGIGTRYSATISQINKKVVLLNEIAIEEQDLTPLVLPSISVGVLKNNTRMEWLIEKSIEIGVAEITLLICQRSERSKINVDRLHKIAVSAMKQSKRLWLPQINGPIKLKSYLADIDGSEFNIAHYISGQIDLKDDHDISRTKILIGPEGDFTPDEIKLAIDRGCSTVNLGSSRLRTETAGLFALTTLNNKLSKENI